MDRWGIETLFSNCVTASEHIREIVGSIFVWPNFIDPEIFRIMQNQRLFLLCLQGQ